MADETAPEKKTGSFTSFWQKLPDEVLQGRSGLARDAWAGGAVLVVNLIGEGAPEWYLWRRRSDARWPVPTTACDVVNAYETVEMLMTWRPTVYDMLQEDWRVVPLPLG